MKSIPPKLILAALAGWALCEAGCARSSGPNTVSPPTKAQRIMLDNRGAAELAARLANDECARRYSRQPFAPQQHPAVLKQGMYEWGGLDVGGPSGFSAFVRFGLDGSNPQVEVYFSSDALTVEKVSPPSVTGPSIR